MCYIWRAIFSRCGRKQNYVILQLDEMSEYNVCQNRMYMDSPDIPTTPVTDDKLSSSVDNDENIVTETKHHTCK